MPNAIIYCRVSTDEQAKSGLGLDAQLTTCQAAATRLGLSVASVYTDDGLSGSLAPEDRPGLLEALGSLKKGDSLLVYRRDRLARGKNYIIGQIEWAVEKCKARIISATEEATNGDEDDPTAQISRDFADLMARSERLLTIMRTKAALQAKARRKERTGALRYGWDLATEGVRSQKNGLVTTMLPNPKEQTVISHMLKWRAAGESLRAIARKLNKAGVPSKNGAGWSHVTVNSTLRYADLLAA
jgi:DNA invertase Pin-like site-specific DNA recombinase